MTDLAAPPIVTARRLLADLEAAGVDAAVVAHVRYGLAVIGVEIRALHRRASPGDWIGRRDVLELVEPGERA